MNHLLFSCENLPFDLTVWPNEKFFSFVLTVLFYSMNPSAYLSALWSITVLSTYLSFNHTSPSSPLSAWPNQPLSPASWKYPSNCPCYFHSSSSTSYLNSEPNVILSKWSQITFIFSLKPVNGFWFWLNNQILLSSWENLEVS